MKKIFGFAAVVAMVAVANVKMASNNNEELTALQLENIEYLAEAESDSGCKYCRYYDFGTYGNGCAYCATGNVCPDYACHY